MTLPEALLVVEPDFLTRLVDRLRRVDRLVGDFRVDAVRTATGRVATVGVASTDGPAS